MVISGPMQCGKATLAKMIAEEDWTYITLDDLGQLNLIKRDHIGFSRSLPRGPVILDEVQRIPELLLYIKQRVDEKREHEKFLLTGSVQLFEKLKFIRWLACYHQSQMNNGGELY